MAGIVEDEVAGGVFAAGAADDAGGLAMPLATVQRITNRTGLINNVSIALRGGVRGSVKRSDTAADRVEGFLRTDQGKQLLGLGDVTPKVEKIKQSNVKTAELVGSVFTTIFLVLGLFSIAAGVMLIFTIFVMLAAERRAEMGIARAVGTRRAQLVQAFLSEGIVYDLLAGVVGAGLGVAAAFWLVIGGAKMVMGEQFSYIAAHVTLRTLVVSYCLGVVLTFITVVVSALQVSRLNVVAAIRGLDEHRRRRERRGRTNWWWVAAGVPALILPPLGLYWLLRKGFGLPWALVLGPAGIALGALLIAAGESSKQAFPFMMGVSLLPLCAALLARYYGAPNRPTWTAVGLFLLVYWLSPSDWHERLFGKMTSGMEMFVLSGIMIVTGFTVVIVFNARLLDLLVQGGGRGNAYRVAIALGAATAASVCAGVLLGDWQGGLGQLFYLVAALLALATALAFVAVRFPAFAPALKMGVAYPLANRFRTGMTIAMFSLIIFSIVVMSVINTSFLQLFGGDEAKGGWDVAVTVNRANPVDDLRAELQKEGSFDPSQITQIGKTTPFEGMQEVRQAGQQEWKQFVVRAGDDAFYGSSQMSLDSRAKGYTSDQAVFEGMRTQPGLAVIDSLPMQPPSPFGASMFDFRVTGVTIKDKQFEPFQVEVHNPVTGATRTLTVVGVLSAKIPSTLFFGLYTNEQTYSDVYGRPDYRLMYLRLVPGTDGERAAKGIKAALVTKGVQAVSIQKAIDDLLAQQRGMMRVIQAFMGLGLFVGIAALGVIAFRSVVERRQQIGMLRAIGYQRGTVALSFILESSFVASMGILSGVIGAAVLSWSLLTSEYFSGTSGLTFSIPWVEVTAFVVVAYAFALLMTWWPSQRAAGVPIAEALRYE